MQEYHYNPYAVHSQLCEPIVQANENPVGRTMLKTASLVSVPVAMGVSWSRNHSVWRTLLAGMFSYVYLAYVGYDVYVKPKVGK